MAESDKVFAGSIPKFYDTLMVPLIFEAYAADLAELVAASSPGSVLETAAGSGVVTRALAPKLSADACYVVTDLNQPMLDYAATRQGSDTRIEWRQADALDLPFEDASFDVVCCQFGAMFFPNRVVGYTEARRVLRPGGRFVFSVWDRIEENAFADDVTNAVAAVFPHDPPRFLARTPHGYHDIALIREELNRAGFADIEIETRDAREGELRALGTRRRLRLLPGNAAAQRNRGARRQLASARYGPRDGGDRQPPWRRPGGRQNSGACDRGGGIAESRRNAVAIPTGICEKRRHLRRGAPLPVRTRRQPATADARASSCAKRVDTSDSTHVPQGRVVIQ